MKIYVGKRRRVLDVRVLEARPREFLLPATGLRLGLGFQPPCELSHRRGVIREELDDRVLGSLMELVVPFVIIMPHYRYIFNQ